MKDQIPTFLLSPELRTLSSKGETSRQHMPFVDRTLRKIAGFIKTGYQQVDATKTHGLLQGIDARIKLLFLVCFVVQANALRTIPAQLWLSIFLLIISTGSRLKLLELYIKVFLFSFFFGFLVIAPAALNLITEGTIVFHFVYLTHPVKFWIYQIPSEIGITHEGLLVVTRLCLKVFNSITVTLLILHTTSFNEIIKALKVFKVPDMFLLIITMSYKFIFILANTVQETYFALKLRWWKKLKSTEANKIIAGRIVYTFRKSWHRYEEVFRAMQARGFTGEVTHLYLKKLKTVDYWFLGLFMVVSLTFYLK